MLYQFHSQEFHQTLPLQIRMFGINHLQPPISRPKGVDYFQWFYCVKGKGEVIVDNQKAVITPQQGFLIRSDTPHSYKGLTADWTLHIMAFTGSVCSEILNSLHMNTSGAYHFTKPEVFPRHIQKLLWLHENRTESRTLPFSKECYDFLLDLSQCISRMHMISFTYGNDLTLTLITYLEENYSGGITLDDLASVVNLNKDYMCALFKSETGRTIMNCLTDIRLGHARQFLMQYPEKKVRQIAGMCGFESPSYFGKVFKKAIGMTPEQYRKN